MPDYFGLDRIISIILCVIPLTSWICGFITRFKDGCYVAGIIRIFFGYIIWIIDLIICICRGCNVSILRIIQC